MKAINGQIEKFLTSARSVSIGSIELNISSPSELDQYQVGYNKDGEGLSLVTGKKGDWKEEWIVIGWNELGDPIFVDLKSHELQVFSAIHGEGSWAPDRIADSLNNFGQILSKLEELSVNRENPVRLDKTPISIKEAHDFLDFVRQNNYNSDIGFWEAIIQVCLCCS